MNKRSRIDTDKKKHFPLADWHLVLRGLNGLCREMAQCLQIAREAGKMAPMLLNTAMANPAR